MAARWALTTLACALVALIATLVACQPNEPSDHNADAPRPTTNEPLAEHLYKPPPPFDETVPVTIAGEEFRLVPALDNSARVKGLANWAVIPPRGGMLFVFPYPAAQKFVMRDCLTDIDIAYLNAGGRVLTTYTMINQPRRPGESDAAYEERLFTTSDYVSGAAATFVVEVAPGTFDKLGVKPGDVIEFDHAALKARAD